MPGKQIPCFALISNRALLLDPAPADLPGTDPIRHPARPIEECDAQLDQLQQVHITLHLKVMLLYKVSHKCSTVQYWYSPNCTCST